jgi:hypothetical protein
MSDIYDDDDFYDYEEGEDDDYEDDLPLAINIVSVNRVDSSSPAGVVKEDEENDAEEDDEGEDDDDCTIIYVNSYASSHLDGKEISQGIGGKSSSENPIDKTTPMNTNPAPKNPEQTSKSPKDSQVSTP